LQTVSALMAALRDGINRPRKQTQLIQTASTWNMLCSSMDVIEDAELAIQSYSQKLFPDDDGEKYLFVYGVLQALFSQQDAVTNLCAALRIPYTPDTRLKEVRDIRNDSIGHPTRRGGGKAVTYHFISRITMRKAGFQLMSTSSDSGDSTFKDISITDLIIQQHDSLQVALSTVLETLSQEEARHREMYKDQKLKDAFPDVLGYYFSKAMEATYGNRGMAYGAMHLGLIVEVLDELKSTL